MGAESTPSGPCCLFTIQSQLRSFPSRASFPGNWMKILSTQGLCRKYFHWNQIQDQRNSLCLSLVQEGSLACRSLEDQQLAAVLTEAGEPQESPSVTWTWDFLPSCLPRVPEATTAQLLRIPMHISLYLYVCHPLGPDPNSLALTPQHNIQTSWVFLSLQDTPPFGQ